ncbi:TadE/TadG family type IV pilus assembly protein [Methylobacterium sp. A54F]
MIPQALARLRGDERGAVLLIFVFLTPVLFGSTAAAIEYGHLRYRRAQLQSAADMGVLSGGNMLKLSNSQDATIASVTDQAIRSAALIPADRKAAITVAVTDQRTSVEAVVEETLPTMMGRILSYPSMTLIVRAKARLVGTMRLCMLALEGDARGAFSLEKKAQVTATNCSLYSNSSDPGGLTGKDAATAQALTICSAGGFDGAKASFTPTPQTGCPAVKDPLADLKLPTTPPATSCTVLTKLVNQVKGGETGNVVSTSTDLDPGTYCGGLHITKNAQVNLRPGVYIMRDGPLIVDQSASITGVGVGFFFSGSKGGMLLDKKTTIYLTAATSGPMAGLLMAEERTVSNPLPVPINLLLTPPPPPPPKLGGTKPLREYRIISDNARTMLGTIYLPAGRLIIDSDKPVADQSAYTVIVAQQINLYEGPNLYLNANYAATTVPVPKGVGPDSGMVSLTR